MRTTADARLELLARGQHGVFTRTDALRCGHSARTIKRRVEIRQWEPLFQGVYTFPSVPPSWLRDQSAAARWVRGWAAGRSAAYLHELPGFEDRTLEVLTKNRKVVPHSGVIVHVTTRLPWEHMTSVQNIPCTSIERTLLDLCGRVRRRRAAIAFDHSLQRGLTTLGDIDHCLYLTARRGRNGCGILRDLLHERLELREFPNSPLETVVLEMLVEAGLPVPQLQYEIFDTAGRFVARPDFVYPSEKLVLEAHSKLWHEGRAFAERDRIRHAKLVELGYKIMYVTWADATRFAPGTAGKIRSSLAERRRPHQVSTDPRRTAVWGA